jgi:hypothetical protein
MLPACWATEVLGIHEKRVAVRGVSAGGALGTAKALWRATGLGLLSHFRLWSCR